MTNLHFQPSWFEVSTLNIQSYIIVTANLSILIQQWLEIMQQRNPEAFFMIIVFYSQVIGTWQWKPVEDC